MPFWPIYASLLLKVTFLFYVGLVRWWQVRITKLIMNLPGQNPFSVLIPRWLLLLFLWFEFSKAAQKSFFSVDQIYCSQIASQNPHCKMVAVLMCLTSLKAQSAYSSLSPEKVHLLSYPFSDYETMTMWANSTPIKSASMDRDLHGF